MTDDRRIQIYQSPDGETRVDVRFEHETVWLTQAQMGQVFDTTPENVLMHLKNIYKTGELESDDNAAVRIPPPLFFFACLGMGLLLEYLSPIHLVSISIIPRVIVGGIFILISIVFI